MTNEGKLQYLARMKKDINEALEVLSIEHRICARARDEVSVKAIKERSVQFELKLDEIALIEKELQPKPEEPAAETKKEIA